ncbi:MAG: phasin family protein [Alphaproteobacteria bacterium]|nr:phasin family protein [Alphaproteobacteria bacterium]
MTAPSFPSFKFPFADVDFTKAFGEFKMPAFGVEALVEAQRKNVAAFTAANQTAFEAVKSAAQRQADMIKLATEEFSKAASELMTVASFEEKAAMQADVAKKAYEGAVANIRELADIVAKGNAEAIDLVNKRIAEALDEMKVLVAKKH